MRTMGHATTRPDRPWYAWVAAAVELFTGLAALPIGWQMVTDPSGGSLGMPADWMSGTLFGTYLVPGLYLLLVNGVAMLVSAALCAMGHRWAPWLTGALGVGLMVWITVQLVLIPETSFLQIAFLAVGLVMGAIAWVWLRRTGWAR